MRQVSDRGEGYLSTGEKRSYMLEPNSRRRSVHRLSPDYDACSARRLAQEKVKKGVAAFLAARDTDRDDSFGFDVRDLCELADLCDIRILVLMMSRTFPVLRWDTDDKTGGSDSNKDQRFYFHFWMTSVQHLEP